jgi:iron(III) transport system ATP-binding protein
MDEPFSSLDGRLRDRVRAETLAFLRETGTTTVVVTHDPGEAMRAGDRIALLRAGRLVQCDTPERLYAHPTTLFAARFFGDVNEFSGVCRQGAVETPVGTFAAPHLPEGVAASVCIRPEHWRIASKPTPVQARVVRVSCLGEVDHVEVAIAGLDRVVDVRAFGRTGLEPDDRVSLDVAPDDVLVVVRTHDERPAAESSVGALA